VKIDELLSRAGDQVGVHRVFGEPIESGGVVVIPVAVVMGGAGGGGSTGPDEGVGGGVGMWARGIGAYEIRDGRLRFVPAIDVAALAVIGLAFARLLAAAIRRARRR
jgi:hypothetical protein